MTSRYCYCPMTAKRIGRRMTLIEQWKRRRYLKRNNPDVYPICGYNAPVFPK